MIKFTNHTANAVTVTIVRNPQNYLPIGGDDFVSATVEPGASIKEINDNPNDELVLTDVEVVAKSAKTKK